MKILVVDDEDSIRELLTIHLRKNGYEVMTAVDGKEAIAKAFAADLILLDVMMPEPDGFEVCRILKSNPSTTAIPVIMLTAKAEEIDKVIGLELGADDYISKPFSARELIARIKAVLRRTKNNPSMQQVLQIGRLKLDFNLIRQKSSTS